MYNYHARVLKVTDGDTLKLRVDCGFGIHKDITVRVRDLDTCETSRRLRQGKKVTEEEVKIGKKAKAFASSLFAMYSNVTISTHKNKKGVYGRYLADVYYGVNPTDYADTMKKRGFDRNQLGFGG